MDDPYSPSMNEKHFFADVELPFHVWVRERSESRGFRWVLREATHLVGNAMAVTAQCGPDQPPDSQAA